jgi:hypothetical protein
MTRFASSALIALFLLPLASSADAASVEVRNRSSWDIHHLYVGPAGDPDWGPDQLGKRIITSGSTFTLTDIRCGRYDVQIVDEDGDACALYDVRLCDDRLWDITDKDLLNCQAETE